MTESTLQTPLAAAVCPQCGAALAAGVPLGLCRSCVATAWLDSMGGEAPEPDDEAPVHFGGFELREQLGRGGMGVVFRAWQPLQREVALKLVSSGRFAGAEEFQRLRLEAEPPRVSTTRASWPFMKPASRTASRGWPCNSWRAARCPHKSET